MLPEVDAETVNFHDDQDDTSTTPSDVTSTTTHYTQAVPRGESIMHEYIKACKAVYALLT